MTVQQTLKTWTVAETIIGVAGLAFTLLLSLVVGCAPRQQGAAALSAAGWIDVTATLDPARTPIYEGDAPLKFDFLKDMRKGDKLTLSVYALGAHSGTHIDAPMHFELDRKSTRLNSSHRCISYAVFCLKKKKKH